MDPKLEMSSGLHNELSSILEESENLAKNQSAKGLSQLTQKIHNMVQNEEFRKNFANLHPTIQRLEIFLRAIEKQWKSSSTPNAVLPEINREVGVVFRDILDTRPEMDPANFDKFCAERKIGDTLKSRDKRAIKRALSSYKLSDTQVYYLLSRGVFSNLDPEAVTSIEHFQEGIDAGIEPNFDPETGDLVDFIAVLEAYERYNAEIWRDEVALYLFNGVSVSDATAKRLQLNPALNELWSIREEAMKKLNEEIKVKTDKGIKQAPEVGQIPGELRRIMVSYSDERDMVPYTKDYGERMLFLCRTIQAERRQKSSA